MIPDLKKISPTWSQDELLSKLKNYSKYLVKDVSNNPNIGILGGISGYSIFHFRCHELFKDEVYLDRGIAALKLAIDRINSGYQFPTYCNGISGFAWAIQYLNNEDHITFDADNFLKEFDDYLYEIMLAELKKGNYDILHGGLGYAYYFLIRYHSTKTEQLRVQYFNILQRILNILNESRRALGDGFLWHSFLDGDPNEPVINLSLSHGNASILRFLTLTESIPPLEKQAKLLLKDCIKAVLGYYRTPNDDQYSFPSIIYPQNKLLYNGRLAWCYGDLGLGYSLFQAAIALKWKDLQNQTLDVLLKTVKMRDPKITGILDSGLCHGFFGVSQMYHRIFMSSAVENFAAARDYWFNEGYKHIESNFVKGIPLQWDTLNDSWAEKGNLLEGIAGIGMCIADRVAKKDNDWDSALFLN